MMFWFNWLFSDDKISKVTNTANTSGPSLISDIISIGAAVVFVVFMFTILFI